MTKVAGVISTISEPAKGFAASSSYLQAIIDSLEDELIVVDENYRIINANEAVLRRHGRRREEVIGEYCYDVSHGLPELCRPPRHECPIKTVWETGKPARVTHLHVYGGQNRFVDIIASPITDEQGKIVAVAELMRDVTEAKQLEMKIAEAHRTLLAMNAIAGVVSQSLDIDSILSSALEKTIEIMQVHAGGILLWDEEKKKICYRVYRGLAKRFAEGVCFRLGEGIAGTVAQTGEAILIEDISSDPRVAGTGLVARNSLRAFASVPLRSKEKVLGVLDMASRDVRKFSTEDVQLLQSIAAEIAVAVENAKLHEEVQRQDKMRGELLREIFSIQEEERRRIARELHDETTQALASMAASLQAVADRLPENATEAKSRLSKLQSLSISILDEIYKLIYELRPSLLDDLGLIAAARWLTEEELKSTGVAVTLRTIGRERRLPCQLETTLFRVIQEAINNIARHAQAKKASVSLHFREDSIKVDVKDDGRGFDIEEAISSKNRPRGLGLVGMKERVELFNGTFKIRSHPGRGTQISIRIPIKGEVTNGENKGTRSR